MTTASQGAFSKLAMDVDGSAAPVFDAGSERYEFLNETLARTQTILNPNGLRGTRSMQGERSRPGTNVNSGTITMNPSGEELDTLLSRILGGSEIPTDVFPLAETLPSFGILIDRVSRRFKYTGCKVSRAVFRGSEGTLLEMALDIEALTEIDEAAVFPATIPAIGSDPPYTFMEGVFTMVGSPREIQSFELTIDNVLDVDRFMNNVNRTQLCARDRNVTLQAVVPYTSSEIDLFNQGVTGSAATIVFTNGGRVLTFTIDNLQVPAESPVVPGKEEITLTLNGVARRTGTDDEIRITNDITP